MKPEIDFEKLKEYHEKKEQIQDESDDRTPPSLTDPYYQRRHLINPEDWPLV